MYHPHTLDEINQRRREREVAAAQIRIARTLRRPTAAGRRASHRFRRRPTAAPCLVGER